MRFFKELDLYIAKKFIKTFFVTILLFIIIIIIFDVAEKLDDFLQKNAPISEIFTVYYVSFIPTLLNTFSPIFIFKKEKEKKKKRKKTKNKGK